ncbi:MAG: tryptophan synthase subunit alpha [Candidatus Omnitrophota bacterium]
MNRIDKKFKELKAGNRKAFIAFITAGYPDLKTTGKLVLEFAKIGVDIVELGVPFSDPLADGPVIQESSQQALKKNTRLSGILSLVKRVRKVTDMPICLMSYYNPIFCFGEERFISKARESGVDGVIIPDLPPEEGRAFIKSANIAGLDVVCFISPTSSLKRIKFISRVSGGFIYYVSLTGVTGARRSLPQGLIKKIKEVKKYTRKPVCVGFGVSNQAQVKQISKFADGVILGSAIVRNIKDNLGSPDLVKKVSAFVRSLKT